MPKLICNPGRRDEAVFDLREGSMLIGRAVECDIFVPHDSLSRRHARLECQDGRVVVSDLKSKNGMWFEGVRVDRHELKVGENLRLGDVVFSLSASPLVTVPVVRVDDATGSMAGDPAVQPTVVIDLRSTSAADLWRDARSQGSGGEGQAAALRLETLLQVNQALGSLDAIEVILQRVLDLVFQILDLDRAAILLVDPKTGRLEPRIVKPESSGDAPARFYSEGIVSYVFQNSAAALFCDAADDPRVDASQSIRHQSIRASMCVPLRVKAETIGVLYVDNLSLPNRFTQGDLDLLAAFGGQAAIAIENANLYRRIQEETIARMELVMNAKLASLNAMVGGIAHEIKNPLNFINNFAELSTGLVRELVTDLEPQRHRLDPQALAAFDESLGMLGDNVLKIHAYGIKATQVIDSMLHHARGGSGVREESDVNALVAEAVAVATRPPSRYADLGIEVDAHYDRALLSLELVRSDVSRVLANLLENACYALRQKKRMAGASFRPVLTLRTRDAGGHIDVSVRDNGTGIPAGIADKIYNPFFTTKPPGEGTGLGLSLSHEIVVQGHQGRMTMTSEPGEFTEFVISFPKRTSSSWTGA
jgi:signal transduction histidine kinase